MDQQVTRRAVLGTVGVGAGAGGASAAGRADPRRSDPEGVAPGEPRVFLDQSARKIASLYLGTTRYEVYRYENQLSMTSGIELFADGELVTDRGKLGRVGTAAEWRANVENWPAPDRLSELFGTLQSIGRRAGEYNDELRGVRTVVQTVYENLRAIRESDTWRRAVYQARDIPRLEWIAEVDERIQSFLSTLSSVRDDVDGWLESTRTLTETVPAFEEDAGVVRRRVAATGQGPTYQRYDDLASRHSATLDALETLETLLDRLERQLEELVEAALDFRQRIRSLIPQEARGIVSEVADFLGEVDADGVNDAIGTLTDLVSGTIEKLRERVERVTLSFRAFVDRVASARQRVAALEEGTSPLPPSFVDDWERRRDANARLYFLFGLGSLVSLVVGMRVWREPLEGDDG